MDIKDAVATIDYELVSGLEIHVQLNTRTKIFCSDSASFGASPNKHISPVSLALPGALPMLNKEVITKAVRMGVALNCVINQDNYFDRKNYFYADLPKGYQITQDAKPICGNGFLDITLSDGKIKRIGINRIHLEEDAGKSLHDQEDNYSLVDLNRAGVPLIEIVTEPDIRSAEEASALFAEIRKLVRYLNVSDGNMEEGSLRCDANISIRPAGDNRYGTRCEVKNLNSIRNVRRAIEFEYNRQKEIIMKGGEIIQSTLTFDADKGTTAAMRSKEEANDYRYFADPDLQPVLISDAWLTEIRSAMPALPAQVAKQLMEEYNIGISDASILSEDIDLYRYFNLGLQRVGNHKSFVNWLLGPIRSILNERQTGIADYKVSPEKLAEVVNLVDNKKLTQNMAIQKLLPALEQSGDREVSELAKSLNILIEENTDGLLDFVDQVFTKYPQQVEAYKKGKKGVLGLFVGEVMKMAHGKADPKALNELILEKLKS